MFTRNSSTPYCSRYNGQHIYLLNVFCRHLILNLILKCDKESQTKAEKSRTSTNTISFLAQFSFSYCLLSSLHLSQVFIHFR